MSRLDVKQQEPEVGKVMFRSQVVAEGTSKPNLSIMKEQNGAERSKQECISTESAERGERNVTVHAITAENARIFGI